MAVKKRDVVLIGKNAAGEQTIDMPITCLGNIDDEADIKDNPTSNDYIPVLDSADNGQMKKTPYVSINDQKPVYTNLSSLAKMVTGEKLGAAFGKIAKAVDELITHLSDTVKHVTAEERAIWNGKANGNHTHTASEVGALSNIKIGTVTTGAAGSSAAASVSTSGTVTTLNLTIPKGDTGAKGTNGTNGAAAGFGTPTATVDANVGTPSVTVTASGANTSKVFNFAFKNLKGNKGDKGDKGDTGATGATPTIKAAAGTNIGSVGTPSVAISTSGTTTTFTFNYLKGATGAKGAKGDTGSAGPNVLKVGTSSPTTSSCPNGYWYGKY